MRLYQLYILDLDGTLFRGNRPLPGAVETVKELKNRGAQIRYLTNNSSLTRAAYQQKLSGMGFPVDLNEVYSSAVGTASYCNDLGYKNLFVVGEPGLAQTLKDSSLLIINSNASGVVEAKVEKQADAVIAGIHKAFNYDILSAAMQQILKGAHLIATNTDATYPVEDSQLIPGAGAIVRSIETCTGQQAFVVGKPNPFLIELVMKEANMPPKETLVVGDRYETDIESGIRAGADTHLVLTGVTKTPPSGQSFSEDLEGLL